MLGLKPERIRALARQPFLSAHKDDRGHWRFDFGDLVVLRTARDLLESGVPWARVRRALAHLRETLPQGRPLTAVRIVANGNRVVVEDDQQAWDAESEQILLRFRVADLAEEVAPIAREQVIRTGTGYADAHDWYELGCQLEPHSPEKAREAYQKTLALDDTHADAHINLGRLLHEYGRVPEAEHHYRRALELRPGDVTALFNLGVALEDLGRLREATVAYRQAILGDARHADAHFNLAGVLERIGEKRSAVRHLKTYRELVDQGWGGRNGE